MAEPTGARTRDPRPPDMLADLPDLASLRFRAMLEAARTQTGRSKTGMLVDWAWRFLRPKGMLLDEYFNLHLHLLDRTDRDPRDTYVGYAESRRINRAFCADDHGQRGYLNDKRLYAALLTGYGLPVPQTQAMVHHTLRLPAERVLRTPEDVANWLLTEARYPLFGKPVRGAGSVGALSLDAADRATGDITMIGGARKAAADLAGEICAKHGHGGYLLMTRLRPAKALRAMAGETMGSVRLVTLCEGGVARPLYALWKVPALNAVADNLWRSGNLLAHLDPQTGEILRASRGRGFAQADHETHPQTGAALVGAQLPDWQAACDLVCRAAELTPRVGLIGWDLALTDSGPVIIEANGGADHTLYQAATGRGFLALGIAPAYAQARAAARKTGPRARRARRMRQLGRAYFGKLGRDMFKKDLT